MIDFTDETNGGAGIVLAKTGIELNDITIIGNLTNNNGVLSGFAYDSGNNIYNYAKINNAPDFSSAGMWEIGIKFKLTELPVSEGYSLYATAAANQVLALMITTGGNIGMSLGNSAGNGWQVVASTAHGSTTLTTATDYYGRIKFTGSAYILSLSTDGETYNEEYNFSSSQSLYHKNTDTIAIGTSRDYNGATPATGVEIDMNHCYIIIDNQYFWQGVKSKYSSNVTIVDNLGKSTTLNVINTNGIINWNAD